jgi:caffeoyl-CoA O-methyltransferase
MINEIDKYAEQHTTPEPKLLQELAEFTRANVSGAQMLCGRVEGRLLKWLVSLIPSKRVLELGTYTGYSALSMAEALPEDGFLLTCDRNPQTIELAKKFIAQSKHGHKVHVIQSEAIDLMKELTTKPERFDFIFIDANKKSNPEYVEYGLQILSEKGMIAIDNTLWDGEVVRPDDSLSKAIAKLNDELVKRNDIEVLLLPVRDGITLIRRKKHDS